MLLKKILLFAALFVLIQQLLFHLFIKKEVSLFWGNGEISSKMDFIKKHPEINTVFLGSSKVKAQIMPAIFDSIVNDGTKSFNLGCYGLFIPEQFVAMDYLLDSTPVKTIFFELRPAYHIFERNLHITRTIYYHTPANYFNTLNIAAHANIPFTRKLNTYSTFTIAEVENLINFNLVDGLITYKNFDYSVSQADYDTSNGFFAVGKGQNNSFIQSHTEINERAAISEKYMRQYKTDSNSNLIYNEVYLKKMNEITMKAKEKKVKLVLLFPPALREFEYKEVLPLLKKLSFLPQINLADAKQYPEFYTFDNTLLL
jgi:hypothetical protein